MYPIAQTDKDDSYLEEKTMTYRDRTLEFSSTVKNLQSKQMLNGLKSVPSRSIQERTEFTRLSKKIGRDLASTCAKLEKLTMLAKRKTLFDDKPLEIQELTYIIKQDLNSLNNQIGQLQAISKLRSSSHTSNKHTQNHSSTVVLSLQSRLANISNDFKSVLDLRTENLKAARSRKEHFTQHSTSSTSAHSNLMQNGGGSVLLRDEELAARGMQQGDADMQGGGGPNNVLRSRHAQQVALMEETDSYLSERASTMENIESSVVELGHIFTQLATMVKEQDETIGHIDQNVDDSLFNINAAHTEILKYFQSVSSNRWLMFKVFGVLIIFFVVFVLLFA